MPDLTPAQVADADQLHATLARGFHEYTDDVRLGIAIDGPEVTTACLAVELREWDHEALAALAAYAIVRTTNQEGTPQ